MNILAIGDICGEGGLKMAVKHLFALKKLYDVHLCIVNGENAAILGIKPAQAQELLDNGADIITLGNHAWRKVNIAKFIEDETRIIRPLNYAAPLPGSGFCVVHSPKGKRVCVTNLLGRLEMNDVSTDSPFWRVNRLFNEADFDILVVDFHAEATSEKLAMAYHLDGRAGVLFGTHTHVPTADERVFPKGMGYITDLGMTGPIESVLGVKPEQSVNYFCGGLPQMFESAPGDCKLQGALFDVDEDTGKCLGVKRIEIT
ncbi:MAG: TIGR00282 family metallophosphoesterase [Oscillospiraceae bacterium]|nr:TIGR00282 family metallophosphoesterase [Oscillospiraceae bacterium]